MKHAREDERARRDEQIVSDFLTALADTRSEEPNIAPAGQIWWRMQLSP